MRGSRRKCVFTCVKPAACPAKAVLHLHIIGLWEHKWQKDSGFSWWHPGFAAAVGSAGSGEVLWTGRCSRPVCRQLVFVWAMALAPFCKKPQACSSVCQAMCLGSQPFPHGCPQNVVMRDDICQLLSPGWEMWIIACSACLVTHQGLVSLVMWMVETINILHGGEREELHHLLSNSSKVTWTRILF